MLIWDNRAVMHQANGDYGDQYRYLYRIIIEEAGTVQTLRNWEKPHDTL